MKVIVLTDKTPLGHRSIAKAIYGMLKDNNPNIQIEYVEHALSMNWWNGFYAFMYRFMPKLGELLYFMSKTRMVKFIVNYGIKIGDKRLVEVVLKRESDLVISAVNWYSQILSLVPNRRFKLATIVTDPWKTYDICFVPGADWHLVYDEKMKQKTIKMGIPEEKIIVTGWWVRGNMFEKYQKEVSDKPIIFIGGGSFGNSAIPRIMRIILGLNKPVKFIVNTGKDKIMFRIVEITKKILKMKGKDKIIEIENYGWIENIAKVLSRADIVFGKAGPNFLFDCIAQEKPFVAITHIWGQEDANLDLIREKKLGWVKEKYGELKIFLNEYLENPKKFNEMYKKTIGEEAERNKKTHQKFTSIVAFPR